MKQESASCFKKRHKEARNETRQRLVFQKAGLEAGNETGERVVFQKAP